MLTRDDFFEAERRFVLRNNFKEPNLILFPVQELESFKLTHMWGEAAELLIQLRPGDEIPKLFGCRCIIVKGGELQFAYVEPVEELSHDGETRNNPTRYHTA